MRKGLMMQDDIHRVISSAALTSKGRVAVTSTTDSSVSLYDRSLQRDVWHKNEQANRRIRIVSCATTDGLYAVNGDENGDI